MRANSSSSADPIPKERPIPSGHNSASVESDWRTPQAVKNTAPSGRSQFEVALKTEASVAVMGKSIGAAGSITLLGMLMCVMRTLHRGAGSMVGAWELPTRT